MQNSKNLPTKRIVALLTGRGGSTLRDKNTLPILGKPLLYYPAKATYESKFISDFYVSSDSPKILNAAEAVGYSPIRRPKVLSKPNSQHEDVIRHAVSYLLKKRKITADILVVVLANSVTVKTKWIDDCIKIILKDPSLTAVVPVYLDSDHHPFRAKKINKEGLCEPFFDFKGKEISTNRQDLDPSYFLCHNFWVLRTSNLDASTGQLPWKFMGDKIKPYIMKERTFDVHEMDDIYVSEKWLKQNPL